MLLSSGEQLSISLLAMALEQLGVPAVSLLGWQAGFNTTSAYGNARIKKMDTDRLQRELDKKNVVIVAGFQGINKFDDITTLGRGGSDTSAVAIAASLGADCCQIYTDAVSYTHLKAYRVFGWHKVEAPALIRLGKQERPFLHGVPGKKEFHHVPGKEAPHVQAETKPGGKKVASGGAE